MNITEKKLNFEWSSLGYYIPSAALLLKALKENLFSQMASVVSPRKKKKNKVLLLFLLLLS